MSGGPGWPSATLLPTTRIDAVPQIADDLVALHSTDPLTVYLSTMARMASLAAAVEQALYADRTVIRHHAMRRTLWVATPEVARLMHAAATRGLSRLSSANLPVAGREWHRRAGGLADGRRRQVLADLRKHGPSTARELGQRIEALRPPCWSPALAWRSLLPLTPGF